MEGRRGPGPSGGRCGDRDVGLFHLTSVSMALRSWEFVMQAAPFDANLVGRRQRSVAEARRRLDRLAGLLDSAVRIPGTGIRLGADSALNLIPGAGTIVAQGMSAYLIWEARRLGVPNAMLAKMVGHVAIDFAISSVPVLGWVGDVFYRANLKNMALLREHLDRHGRVIDGRAEPVVEAAGA